MGTVVLNTILSTTNCGRGVLAGVPQYRIFTDEDGLQWRKGIRDGYIVLDVALTSTGFGGTEDVDWENVENTLAFPDSVPGPK